MCVLPGEPPFFFFSSLHRHANAEDMLAGIEEKIKWAQRAEEDNKRHKEQVEARVEAVKRTVKVDVDIAACDEGLDLMDEDLRSGIGSKRRR